jgi:hypothetical protein
MVRGMKLYGCLDEASFRKMVVLLFASGVVLIFQSAIR